MSDAHATSSDPIFTTVDALVRDGTLDHAQADRVYAAMRSGLPSAATGAPAPATAPIAAPAAGPRDIHGWSLQDRLAAAGTLLGSGLVLGETLVSAYVSEGSGDFPLKSFLVALGATVALAILTAAVHVVIPDRGYSRWFVAGPAGLAALAFGLTVGIALSDWDDAGYAIGAATLLGGAAGYFVARSGAAVAAAVLGGLILFGYFLSDVTPSDSESLLWISVPAVLYGIGVAAAGWALPTRHISALLGGIVALSGVIFVLGFVAFARLILRGVLGVGGGGGDFGPDYSGDAATTMVLGLLVCLGLVALYALSGHPGYAVVGTLGAVLVILTGMFALDLEHTLRSAAIVAVLGAAVAGGSALLPLRRHRRPRPPREVSAVQPVPRVNLGHGQAAAPPHADATQQMPPAGTAPAPPPPAAPPPPPPAAPPPPLAAPPPAAPPPPPPAGPHPPHEERPPG
jgi:hypothetical protein